MQQDKRALAIQQLKSEIRGWHKSQSTHLKKKYFLYYTSGKEGIEFIIRQESMNDRWKKVSPDKVNPRMSGRQVLDWALEKIDQLDLKRHSSENPLCLIDIPGRSNAEERIARLIKEEVSLSCKLIEIGIPADAIKISATEKIYNKLSNLDFLEFFSKQSQEKINDQIVSLMNAYVASYHSANRLMPPLQASNKRPLSL